MEPAQTGRFPAVAPPGQALLGAPAPNASGALASGDALPLIPGIAPELHALSAGKW